MPCPFKLVICTSVLCLAIVAYWLHYHFSETTLDYILQFVPLPEHYKDRLYDFLLGEGCESTQSIVTTTSTTTATPPTSSSSTCSTTNLTAIAPPERSTMINKKKDNNNNNNNNNNTGDEQQEEEEEPTRRTQLPTTQQSTTTITYPTTRKRKQHNFQRHEIPKIIKVFKYIMMVMIVYLHVEIFYYYFTQKCFAAQMARNIDHYTGLEIVKALKAAPPPLTLSTTSGH